MLESNIIKRLDEYIKQFSDIDVNTRQAIEKGLCNELDYDDDLTTNVEDFFYNLSFELNELYLKAKFNV